MLIFSWQVVFPQSEFSEEDKIKNLIEVWGLLKYHHPDISRGKYDINREFVGELAKLEKVEDKKDFDAQLLAWVKSFGTEDLRPNKDWKKKQGLFSQNADFEWIKNSGFSAQLEELLQNIRYNTNYKDHYASVNKWSDHINFEKDLPLETFDVSNKAHRILFLAQFWNAMNYWNVNIHLTETPVRWF